MMGFFFFIVASHLFAQPVPHKWSYKNINEAKKSTTFFKFTGESTKFGLITTSFEGYALAGELTFRQEGDELKDILLKLLANQIDTDSSARNEKMWEKCLRVNEHSEIVVKILGPIKLNLSEQTVSAFMMVAGTEVPLTLSIKKKNQGFRGESQFKLSEAKIPDPSIVIAKVNDTFKIYFEVY